MKMIWRLGLSLILAFAIGACFNPPEYPTTPDITLNKIKFVETPDLVVADTLTIYLNFKDGDGDIGLDKDEVGQGQYAERYYFKIDDQNTGYYLDDPTQVSQLAKDPSFVRYKTKRTDNGYDTLPAYVKPYDCINWEIVYQTVNNITTPLDTLYFQLNPNHYNIFIDFLVMQSNGVFTEYDFRKEFCTTYNGRIPVLSKDLSQPTPLEGTIRYDMTGTGFKLIFGNKSMKLRIKIQDRALNQSNELETDPFQLNDLK